MKRACVQIGSKGWTQGKKPLVLSATGRYSQRHNQPATEKRPRQSQRYSQPGIKTCHVQLDLADVPASLAGDSTLAVLQLEALHKGKSLQPTTYPFALAPAHMSSLQGSVSYASTIIQPAGKLPYIPRSPHHPGEAQTLSIKYPNSRPAWVLGSLQPS